jgi:hypothetical protein
VSRVTLPFYRRWSARLLLAVLTVAALGVGGWIIYVRANANPGCEAGRRSACTRIFFIGNSYTSVNDLPTMFSNLAWSGGHRVETAVNAPGGATLLDHSHSSDTTGILASSRWDIVVLQEQSEIPSVESMRQAYFYPGARDLVPLIRDGGAHPLFFVTWAHRNGWPINRLPDYTAMQSALDDGYLFIAHDQNASVSPVGFAWASVVSQGGDAGLWQDDGSHPTAKGTYLAAAVFYASVFLDSPVGLKFQGGLSAADALQVQQAAAGTVLADPARWGLPIGG